MNGYKDGAAERRTAAEAARKAMQQRFAERPAPDDAAIAAKKAERQAILEARQARMAERQVRAEAENARREEAARADAAEQARLEELAEQDRLLELERAEQLSAKQKQARDLRYAARKARR